MIAGKQILRNRSAWIALFVCASWPLFADAKPHQSQCSQLQNDISNKYLDDGHMNATEKWGKANGYEAGHKDWNGRTRKWGFKIDELVKTYRGVAQLQNNFLMSDNYIYNMDCEGEPDPTTQCGAELAARETNRKGFKDGAKKFCDSLDATKKQAMKDLEKARAAKCSDPKLEKAVADQFQEFYGDNRKNAFKHLPPWKEFCEPADVAEFSLR